MMKTYKNRIFRLVEPHRFTEDREDISKIPEETVLVKPTYGSICQADMRYFTGKRRKEDLEKKLPMALIHECVGKVEEAINDYMKGDSVVLVPNIPGYIHSPDKFGGPCETCLEVGENYCPEAHFCSSGYDGFTKRYNIHPKKCVLKLPDSVPEETGVYCELLSVINNMYERLPRKKSKIAVFGDGPMSYLTSLYLSQKEIGKDKESLWVVGIDDSKLENFDSCNTIRFDDNHLEEYLKT